MASRSFSIWMSLAGCARSVMAISLMRNMESLKLCGFRRRLAQTHEDWNGRNGQHCCADRDEHLVQIAAHGGGHGAQHHRVEKIAHEDGREHKSYPTAQAFARR